MFGDIGSLSLSKHQPRGSRLYIKLVSLVRTSLPIERRRTTHIEWRNDGKSSKGDSENGVGECAVKGRENVIRTERRGIRFVEEVQKAGSSSVGVVEGH